MIVRRNYLINLDLDLFILILLVFWMGHKGSMEARYTTNKRGFTGIPGK